MICVVRSHAVNAPPMDTENVCPGKPTLGLSHEIIGVGGTMVRI